MTHRLVRGRDPVTAESLRSVGGALLIITDHYPFGDAVETLAQRLGLVMTKGVVEELALNIMHWLTRLI